jgi:hypothetical protein
VRGCVNAEAATPAVDIHQGDDHVVADLNPLADFSRKDQHVQASLASGEEVVSVSALIGRTQKSPRSARSFFCSGAVRLQR